MMDPTKPESLPLFVALVNAGWSVETGDFGANGCVKRFGDYRIGNHGKECRQLMATRPDLVGFYVEFTQIGDLPTFAVQLIAKRNCKLKLRHGSYTYAFGHVTGDTMLDEFKTFIMIAINDEVSDMRNRLKDADEFLQKVQV